MNRFRIFAAAAVLLTASCSSSLPTTTSIENYYQEAEKSAQRDIDRLAALRAGGRISAEEYDRREKAIKESIPRRASNMAWAKHELTQSQMVGMAIPTPDHPVNITAPGRGSSDGSFYRQAGQTGPGYQQSSSQNIFRSSPGGRYSSLNPY